MASGSPWERAKKSRSQRQEEHPERLLPGARRQSNSGRGQFRKGDATLNSFLGRLLIDHKTHDDPEKQSYTITRKSWLKTRSDARFTPPGCHPVQQVDLQDIHLMVFEAGLWNEIVEYMIELEERAGTNGRDAPE